MSGIGGELSFAPDGSDFQRARTQGLPAWWRDSANAWERYATVDGERLREAGEVSACCAAGPFAGALPDVAGKLEVKTLEGHPTLPPGRVLLAPVEEVWGQLAEGRVRLGRRPGRHVDLTADELAKVQARYEDQE